MQLRGEYMNETKDVTIYEGAPAALRPEAMKAQVALIQDTMKSVMRNGEHYGVIPGCGDKPTLLQSGAQKLIMTFRLVPDPEVTVIDLPNEHREYRVKVNLKTQTGIFLGAGIGSCSTMEGKYRYRKADLICPECGQVAIIKGKAEFGGGWICYQKKGGCGKKWSDAESPFGVITSKVEHDNPADYWNTCEKMAFKRALVSATLTVTAASDIFTQDVEDMPEIFPTVGSKSEIKPPQAIIPPHPINAIDPPSSKIIVTGLIDDIRRKSGKKKNGDVWTLYFITINGEDYSTFSLSNAEEAKKAKEAGMQVEVSYTQKEKGKNLDSIKILDNTEAEVEKIPETPVILDPEGCTKNPKSCDISSFGEKGEVFCGTGNIECKFKHELLPW